MRRSPFSRHSRQPPLAMPPPPERRRVGRSRVPLHRRVLGARSALGYWTAVLVLALATATIVSRLVSRVAAAERRFGSTRPVLVTTKSLQTGEPVTPTVVRLEDRPVSQLPSGALARLPVQALASGPVAHGEVLTEARLASRSTSAGGTAAGRAVIAVPLGDAPLALHRGDHVDVYATYDPALVPAGSAPTARVAEGAEVVRAGRTSISVSIRRTGAPALAAAVARSTVTVALVD